MLPVMKYFAVSSHFSFFFHYVGLYHSTFWWTLAVMTHHFSHNYMYRWKSMM